MRKNTKSTFVGWKRTYPKRVSNYYLTKTKNYIKTKVESLKNKLRLYKAHLIEKSNFVVWKTPFFLGAADYLSTSAVIAFIILTVPSDNPFLQGLGVTALLRVVLAFVGEWRTQGKNIGS